MNNESELKHVIEAVLFAADEPMDMKRLMGLFPEDGHPGRNAIQAALDSLAEDCESRSIELKEVKSGYRFQVRQNYADWVGKLWEEKPARYSRAAMETMALIAYRQPITRAEIEEVRGVSVSSQIIKTLMERDWVKIVGHRDVPGKPALYATTSAFLDYFNLKSLEELPTLADIKDIDSLNVEMDLTMPDTSEEMVEENVEDTQSNAEAQPSVEDESTEQEAMTDEASEQAEEQTEVSSDADNELENVEQVAEMVATDAEAQQEQEETEEDDQQQAEAITTES